MARGRDVGKTFVKTEGLSAAGLQREESVGRGGHIGCWANKQNRMLTGFVLFQFWLRPQKVASRTIGGDDIHMAKCGCTLAHHLGGVMEAEEAESPGGQEGKGRLCLPAGGVRARKESAWFLGHDPCCLQALGTLSPD